jgi:uracil-DNA glycosylase
MILMAMVLKHASSSLDKLCAVPRCESSRERTHDGQSKEADHVRLFATMHPSELAQKKKKPTSLSLSVPTYPHYRQQH